MSAGGLASAALAVLGLLLLVSLGCGDDELATSSRGDQTSKAPGPLTGWWEANWSEDGTELNVRYNRGSGTLSESTQVEKHYNPYGIQTGGQETKNRNGEDIYGREQHTSALSPSAWLGGRVKPESAIASGTIAYPAGMPVDQGLFARRLEARIQYEYDGSGSLKGGSGTEDFSGHVSGSAGRLAYSGSIVANFTARDGELVWTERTETTSYSYDGRPYAETVTVVTPDSEYLGGALRVVRETIKTTTTYADGSRRESDIVIVWQRDENGVVSGKSGDGTFTGSDIVKGKRVDYVGSITVDYGFDSRIGWYKVGYSEKRSAEGRLPERLPFEVIFVDDPYFSVFEQ